MQSQRVDIQLKMPEILFKSFQALTLSLKRMKAKLYMEQQTARVVVLDCVALLAVALVQAVRAVLVAVVVITLVVVLAALAVKVVDLVATRAVRHLVLAVVGMMDAPVAVLQHAELVREYAVTDADIIAVLIVAGAIKIDPQARNQCLTLINSVNI